MIVFRSQQVSKALRFSCLITKYVVLDLPHLVFIFLTVDVVVVTT